LISLLFFFYWLVDHPDLHSFPTRRSSDLQMMGVPAEDRPYVRQLAEKLLYIGRGEHDRMPILTEGMKGMVEYVSPLVDERMVRPDRKSTRLNSSHVAISYAVFCLKKKKKR